MRQKRLLIVFVKAPRIGHVKTRLAQAVGPEAACLIYQLLADRVLTHLESLKTVQLRFSPDDAEKEIRPWRRKGWTLAAQGSGHLGQRLTRAFSEAFDAGFTRVVAIGSDAPEVTQRDVEDAWSGLTTCDAVLGPTKDGGYWLIGLNKPVPKLFQRIPWSTDRVFQTTLKRARTARLRVHRLREMEDIDTEEDWKAYLRRNAFAQLDLRR